MCAQNSFLRSLGVEIYASGHRRWPDDVRARAVVEALEPGATVNAVAERFDLQPNQLSAWRRLAQQGKLVLPAPEIEEPVFAPLVVCEVEPEEPPREMVHGDEGIRIVVGEVRIELASDTPARRIAEIVYALGSRPC